MTEVKDVYSDRPKIVLQTEFQIPFVLWKIYCVGSERILNPPESHPVDASLKSMGTYTINLQMKSSKV